MTFTVVSGTHATLIDAMADKMLDFYQVNTLEVSSGATADGSVIITMNGVDFEVTGITNGLTASQVAGVIRAFSFAGWVASGETTTVIFTATTKQYKGEPSFNDNSTGVSGSIIHTSGGHWVDADPAVSQILELVVGSGADADGGTFQLTIDGVLYNIAIGGNADRQTVLDTIYNAIFPAHIGKVKDDGNYKITFTLDPGFRKTYTVSANNTGVTGVTLTQTQAGSGLGTTCADFQGRVIRYQNGSENLYVQLLYGNVGNNQSGYVRFSYGVLMFVSSGYDLANHIPTGTIEFTMIPTSSSNNSSSLIPPMSSIATEVYAVMWYEDDMLTVFGYQTTSVTNLATLGTFFFTMERDTTKEFADGLSNFYFFSEDVYHIYNYSGTSTAQWGLNPSAWSLPAVFNPVGTISKTPHKYIHPFGPAYPNGADVPDSRNFPVGVDWTRIKMWIPIKARKADSNGKVYLGFPVAYGDLTETFMSPQKTMRSFFVVENGKGLTDGDLINVNITELGETWQYIYKSFISASGLQMDLAMKYAELS